MANKKAVGLLSGGLDSRLALKMLKEQGVEVVALNFVTPFCNCTAKSSCKMEARKASEEFGIELRVIPLFEEFMEAVRQPKYGYGSGMNPCLDCRILMFKKAKEMMEEIGASFVVTGEVLGERPMSQRLDAIRIIERDSGLEGLIVRPLSARLFEPSVPEREGWVDREKLLGISGRSRKPQIDLAEKLDIGDYPCPAGGCLLTDKAFAVKLRSFLGRVAQIDKNDVALLKVGRHYIGQSGCEIVVGRNEAENERVGQLKRAGDWIVTVCEWLGPTTLVRGPAVDDADLRVAAELTAGYGKGKDASLVAVECQEVGGVGPSLMNVSPGREAVAAVS